MASRTSHGDPLALLRKYNVDNRISHVKMKDTRIEFEPSGGGSKIVFDRKTKTAYRSQKGRGEAYELDALLLFLKHKDIPRKEYMSTANQFGVAFVSMLDKKELVSYLSGKVETVPAIQAIEVIKPLTFDTIPSQEGAKKDVGGSGDGTKASRSSADASDTKAEPEKELANWAEDLPEDPKQLLAKVRDVERNLQDHNSILMCPVQTFDVFLKVASDCIDEYNHAKKKKDKEDKELSRRDDKSKRSEKKKGPPMERIVEHPKAGPDGVKINPRTGLASTNDVRLQFERDQYTKNRFGEANLDINEYGRQAAPVEDAAMPVAAPVPVEKMEVDPAPFERKRREREEEQAQRERDKRRRREKEASRDSKSRSRSSEADRALRQRMKAAEKEKTKRPIVLIPPGYGCILNRYNACKFLQEGVFQKWEDTKFAKKKERPPATQVIRRKLEGVQFKITEEIPRPDDWDRVCAVIVTGKKWQFKQFPSTKFVGLREGNLATLFSSVCGFYFHFSSDPIPSEVSGWNVKPIAIDKNNRHKDIAGHREFWTRLDKFLTQSKFKYNFK